MDLDAFSMIDAARRQIMPDAWRLAKPYWISEEQWSAWGLLLAVIALTSATSANRGGPQSVYRLISTGDFTEALAAILGEKASGLPGH